MNRRSFVAAALAGLGSSLTPRQLAAQDAAQRAVRALPTPRIKDVEVIATAPGGDRLTVVKILTDQDGLHGYGCATFTQRADAVNTAIEKYLRPFLVGKPTDRIDDLWQAMYNSSYWRNGPVLNNAISGVDQALWDIKGRQAGMPVYQLLGGKCREAADCYTHASGAEIPQAIESARAIMARGFRHVRIQVAVPGMSGYGASSRGTPPVQGLHSGPVFEPAVAMRRQLQVLEAARKELGEEVELLHDMHERYPANMAVQFAKAVEPLRLFFLEDALSPEDIAYFRQIRQNCATPIAMGELFDSPHEWRMLIDEGLIDFIRMHVSAAGGLTPMRKVAAAAELHGIRTAWHGPGDVSPIGHACNVALDLACYNFGIQEYTAFNARSMEVFSGVPVMKDGYFWANESPGWGIEVDEAAAKKYPYGTNNPLNGSWGEIRKIDGTIIKQ
jgi:mannonate dehydratase